MALEDEVTAPWKACKKNAERVNLERLLEKENSLYSLALGIYPVTYGERTPKGSCAPEGISAHFSVQPGISQFSSL